MGMVTTENAIDINCKDSLLRSENTKQVIIGLDLQGIVAVAMPDAVLVTKKSSVQKVKNIVENLKVKGICQANQFPKDHCP